PPLQFVPPPLEQLYHTSFRRCRRLTQRLAVDVCQMNEREPFLFPLATARIRLPDHRQLFQRGSRNCQLATYPLGTLRVWHRETNRKHCTCLRLRCRLEQVIAQVSSRRTNTCCAQKDGTSIPPSLETFEYIDIPRRGRRVAVCRARPKLTRLRREQTLA